MLERAYTDRPFAGESSPMIEREKIRNVAIVAHVDHGKTTLVDFMLRQAGVFRANEQMVDRVMDSNDLSAERITIRQELYVWQSVKISIVDTPATPTGGEVARAPAGDRILLSWTPRRGRSADAVRASRRGEGGESW
jgi:hypothetical protein